jgi:hypothetical protein
MAAARSAAVDFRLALLQRPVSPFAWANLALAKLYLDEADDELLQALARAQELGPWEPEVQQTVVYVGLATWDRLQPQAQAAIVRTMQRGARRDAAKIAGIAGSFKRLELFCGAIDDLTKNETSGEHGTAAASSAHGTSTQANHAQAPVAKYSQARELCRQAGAAKKHSGRTAGAAVQS